MTDPIVDRVVKKLYGDDESPTVERAVKRRVEGVVYCLTHTAVHDDTLDPYDYGEPSCLTEAGVGTTKAMVHRTVFVGLRKGDFDEEVL